MSMSDFIKDTMVEFKNLVHHARSWDKNPDKNYYFVYKVLKTLEEFYWDPDMTFDKTLDHLESLIRLVRKREFGKVPYPECEICCEQVVEATFCHFCEVPVHEICVRNQENYPKNTEKLVCSTCLSKCDK